MFGWFKKKKTEVKVEQKARVDQRGARAGGDIVGGNKYSTYSYTPGYNPNTDMLNSINPLSPLNPMNQPSVEESTPRRRDEDCMPSSSYDSSSSWSSSYDSSSSCDSSSSSSYDSGSSSCDSSSY